MICEEEQNAIDSRMWWVACKQTPYLIKFATVKNTILLNVSDLVTVWSARMDERKILKDKELYAKTLQVQNTESLIELLGQILANPDPKAVYKFIHKKDNTLVLELHKQIEVYPLTWKFQLDCNDNSDIIKMLCKDIITPLHRVLNAHEKRYQLMKKKMQMQEKEYKKKLSQAELKNYKSVIDEELNLKRLVEQPSGYESICELTMQKQSKDLFEFVLGSQKPKQLIKNNSKQRTKVQKKVRAHEGFNAEEIQNEIEMKKQEELHKKAKKKKDFL